MLCQDVYQQGAMVFTCGRCLSCRINRRRTWTARLVLESLLWGLDSSFITLTYDEKNCPIDGSLKPKDLQDFIKRLRRHFNARKIRYYAVGEYGDRSFRPHYHLVVYGVGPLEIAGSDFIGKPLSTIWGKGFVYATDVNENTAQYVAQYVCKKMTSRDDPRLGGKFPEFSRMSLKPGIGKDATSSMAQSLLNGHGWEQIEGMGDVPSQIRLQGKKYPIGRYLKKALRLEMGFSSDKLPLEGERKVKDDLLILQEEAKIAAAAEGRPDSWSVKRYLQQKNLGAIINLEAKQKLKRRNL